MNKQSEKIIVFKTELKKKPFAYLVCPFNISFADGNIRCFNTFKNCPLLEIDEVKNDYKQNN